MHASPPHPRLEYCIDQCCCWGTPPGGIWHQKNHVFSYVLRDYCYQRFSGITLSPSPLSPWSLCSLHQHEYQHQLEFTHEGSTTSTSTEAVRGGGGGRRGAVRTGRSVNGTGARGRQLAAAADRRRAERGLRLGVGEDLLGVHGGDAREAQRARWVMRMQEQVEGRGCADSARSGPQPRVRGRDPPLPSDLVQLAPTTSSSAPTPSRHTSLSSSLGLRDLATSSEAAPLETGQRINGTAVGRNPVSHDHGSRRCLVVGLALTSKCCRGFYLCDTDSSCLRTALCPVSEFMAVF